MASAIQNRARMDEVRYRGLGFRREMFGVSPLGPPGPVRNSTGDAGRRGTARLSARCKFSSIWGLARMRKLGLHREADDSHDVLLADDRGKV